MAITDEATASKIVPLHPERGERWDDFTVNLSPKQPRIAPGVYEAHSVSLERTTPFGRPGAELLFDVLDDDGSVLARVPYYMPLPVGKKKPLRANTKLAKLLYRVGARHGETNPKGVSRSAVVVPIGRICARNVGGPLRGYERRDRAPRVSS
jgi:hypothetical protein